MMIFVLPHKTTAYFHVQFIITWDILPPKISETTIQSRAWISNNTRTQKWYVIIQLQLMLGMDE